MNLFVLLACWAASVVIMYLLQGMLSNLPKATRPSAGRRVGWILAAGGMVNFFIFSAVGQHIGGSAFNSDVAHGGRFYVAQYGHLTEVSKATWIYSYLHTLSSMGTWPLVFYGGYLLHKFDSGRRRRFRRRSD